MLPCIPLRHALPVVLAALLPAAAFAQSQDTPSVAEAARSSRVLKKNPGKPVKVITEETLDVKMGDVQSATAEQLRIPGTPETQAQPAAGAANAQGTKNPSEDEKVRAALKDRVALKEKIAAMKQRISDKQQELDQLKARLAAMPEPQEGAATTPKP